MYPRSIAPLAHALIAERTTSPERRDPIAARHAHYLQRDRVRASLLLRPEPSGTYESEG